MIKKQRNISGIYFRYKNEETDRFENRTFEDLPENKQDEVIKERNVEWLQSLAKQLATTINIMADELEKSGFILEKM